MVISKTPFRMSFFGGGTDLPEFFREEGGSVISTTIDKYCFVIARHLPKFFDYSTEVVYSKIERVNDVNKIEHPAVRETMKMLHMQDVRLDYEADLPGRSGLGTSSSFEVGMLNVFYAMKGQYANKRRLAEDAIYVERILCREAGGWQDQIAASYGGLNRINFKGDQFEVLPIVMPTSRKKALQDRLLMFFTGFTRFSAKVQEQNVKSDPEERRAALRRMMSTVDEAEDILKNSSVDLDEFGKLLDKSWRLKRRTGSGVSTDQIDVLYERGIRAGALGGKLLGAGGGGFMVFYVPEDKIKAVKQELSDLLYIPFQFETTGSSIIHYSEDEHYNLNSRELF